MLKKKLSITLSLIIILLILLANAESELTKDEVIAVAIDYFGSIDVVSEEVKNAYHLNEEDVTCIGKNMNGESIWYVPFFRDSYTDTSCYYDQFLILIHGTTGEIKLAILPSSPPING